jgi:acyl carrier protein
MVSEQVREVLAKHARLGVDISTISDDGDLYNAGLTSLTTVNVMLALEDQFSVEFPEKMLGRKTFQSVRSLSESISELLA